MQCIFGPDAETAKVGITILHGSHARSNVPKGVTCALTAGLCSMPCHTNLGRLSLTE